jgi:hypothetical protein
MIGTELDLYIFYKGKRNRTQDQATNTDKNLVPVIINKVVLYRNLEKVRQSYNIDNQDPYFFIQKKLLLSTVVH